MAIDSLGSSTAINYSQYSITTSGVAPAQDSDGDNGGSTQRASGTGGRFATAIEATLAQLTGGSSTSTTAAGSTSSSSSQDPTQAEQAFAQSLFSALQSQFSSQQPSAQGSEAQGSGHHHHHGGGGGGSRLASAIEGLSQQLGSSSTTSDTSSTPSTSSTSSDLQTSFNNLLAATGQSSSSTTLSQFLQGLAQNLHGGTSSGNLLNVKA